MRIRGRKLTDASSDLSVSSSPSSSITTTHSSLAASSQDSTSNSSGQFSSIGSTSHRCHGLDLLVKAIHQVSDGSVIGVPYIQRRVTTRRRRRIQALHFDALFFSEKKMNNKNKNKKNKVLGLRSQIQDSVFQSWGRRSDEMINL